MSDESATPTSQMQANSNAGEEHSTPSLSSHLPPLQDNFRRFYLIRHGETDWNVEGRIQGGGHDIPLNENGRAQAAAVAQEMHDIPLTVICSSPLSRAKDTADILMQDHPTTIAHRVMDEGLQEMGFGEFEGFDHLNPETDVELLNHFKSFERKIDEDPDFAFPGGGESLRMVEKRACQALQNLLDKYPDDKHIAVVSHGRTNKIMIASVALQDVRKFRWVKQKNTAVSVLDVDTNGNFIIRMLDYFEHVKDNVIIR